MTGPEGVTVCLLLALLPLLERLPAPAALSPRLSRRPWAAPLLYFFLITATLACRCLVLSQHGATSFIYFQF